MFTASKCLKVYDFLLKVPSRLYIQVFIPFHSLLIEEFTTQPRQQWEHSHAYKLKYFFPSNFKNLSDSYNLPRKKIDFILFYFFACLISWIFYCASREQIFFCLTCIFAMLKKRKKFRVKSHTSWDRNCYAKNFHFDLHFLTNCCLSSLCFSLRKNKSHLFFNDLRRFTMK